MKKTILMSVMGLLATLGATSAFCLEISPKHEVRFYCSEDAKSMLVTDGTETSAIRDDIVNWSSGFPRGGCNSQMVHDITKTGFFCDGHYLTDYQGNQEIYMNAEACERAVSAKPKVRWN